MSLRKWTLALATLLLFAIPGQAMAMPPEIVADRKLWADPKGPVSWAKDVIDDAIRYEFFVGYPRGTEQFDLGRILDDKPNGVKVTLTYTPEFRPMATITRAEFATILARATGFEEEYQPGDKLPFRDTPANAWYAPYLAALVKKNVIRLTDRPGDNFLPDDPVTRVEIATWTARAADAYGVRIGPAPLTFRDADKVAPVYRQDVGKAVALGIVKGYEDNTFRPHATATRAEAAAMLVRLLKHFTLNPPTKEELMQASQAIYDAVVIWMRDNPGAKFATSNWTKILSPWYMPGVLTWWAVPKGEPCQTEWEVAEPRALCKQFDKIIPANTAQLRRDPFHHYGATQVLDADVLASTDRTAEVRLNLRSVPIPADDNRTLAQFESTVVVYLRKDGGRWKYADERDWKIIQTGYFDRTLPYRMDGKTLADLP